MNTAPSRPWPVLAGRCTVLASVCSAAAWIAGCETHQPPHQSTSAVPIKRGDPIPQARVFPEREKIILKEGEAD